MKNEITSARPYPAWLKAQPAWKTPLQAREQQVALLYELATENVRQGGGPFAAMVLTEQGEILSMGTNEVVHSCDSTAHAEIVAMRRAQQYVRSHSLSGTRFGPLELVSSCTPCIQCFGAIWWSGIASVYAAADASLAEAVGFNEGPVGDVLWERLEKEREVSVTLSGDTSDAARAAFDLFRQDGVPY